MGFTLDRVVPWGRSFEEYVAMFDLSDDDLGRRILGCGDGPAGFNAELTRRGGRVISIDPIYAFSAMQIRQRIDETYQKIMTQLENNRDDYIWSSIASVDELGRIRMSAMEVFLADYAAGKDAGRYVEGELPSLPFDDNAFDIALSSHFLFLYSSQLSAEFHVNALVEMLRVAREVRVFPLLCLDGTPSSYVSEITGVLEGLGFQPEICPVNYEFQRSANAMLRVTSV
jgi:SAM-dependent methyltransferase